VRASKLLVEHPRAFGQESDVGFRGAQIDSSNITRCCPHRRRDVSADCVDLVENNQSRPFPQKTLVSSLLNGAWT